jgi:hypothetical protein
MKVWGLRIYLAIYAVSFILSCVLGPRRGHSRVISALGGFALGPFNLLLIWLVQPPGRGRNGRPRGAP